MRVFLMVLGGLTLLGVGLVIGVAVLIVRGLSSIELTEEDLAITPVPAFAALAVIDERVRAHGDRLSFACADPDEVFGPWTPDEIARELGLEGDWVVVEEGQREGIPWQVIADVNRRPPKGGPFGPQLIDMGGDTIVCVVAAALVTPSATP